MSAQETFYPECRFGGFTDADGNLVFMKRVHALLRPSFTVLDVGCGRGAIADQDEDPLRNWLKSMRGKVARVIGIDVDRAGFENPTLDEFHPIEGAIWPVESESIDLLVCRWVMEHIEDPDAFFREVRRVVKDGGYVCICTANRWSYIAVGARLVPNRLHTKMLSRVQPDRKVHDVFDTFYRANTRTSLRRHMEKAGLKDCVVYSHEPDPAYLSFSKVAYCFGVLWQRYAPAYFRSTILAFGRMRK